MTDSTSSDNTGSDNTSDAAQCGAADLNQVLPPARRPCGGCPYRRDVPSGVWERSEYEKLPDYDAPTPYQPPGIFICHLTDGTAHRVCAGWAGCHDGEELLSLRIAVAVREISPETYRLTVLYESPVPLFASGAEAAAHGMEEPTPAASRVIEKILRVRTDIIVPAADPPPAQHHHSNRRSRRSE